MSVSTLNTSAMAISTLTGSTLNASSINVSTLSGSTLTASTMTGNQITISTLTVSSINNGTPGVAAYSTFNASSINVTSTTTTSTLSTLLVNTGSLNSSGNIIKLGTTVGNDTRLEGGTATNSGYVNFVHSNTSRGYIGNATTTDLDVVAQNGAKLNFYTAGGKRLEIDIAGTVSVVNNFKKISATNPTTTYLAIYDGGADHTPYIDFTLSGTRKAYIGYATTTNFDFAVENGANLSIWTNGTTRMLIAATGGINIYNGLNVVGGAIACVNQPFVIVGGVAGANITYAAGTNFGSSGNLLAYTSAGYSNTSGSGWESSTGRFWATLAGRYQVNFTFFWNGFNAGSRAIMRHFNSAGTHQEDRYCAASSVGHGTDTVQTYSTIVYMSAGSYLEFNFQSGGGSLYFGGIIHTHCSFHFIA